MMDLEDRIDGLADMPLFRDQTQLLFEAPAIMINEKVCYIYSHFAVFVVWLAVSFD